MKQKRLALGQPQKNQAIEKLTGLYSAVRRSGQRLFCFAEIFKSERLNFRKPKNPPPSERILLLAFMQTYRRDLKQIEGQLIPVSDVYLVN